MLLEFNTSALPLNELIRFYSLITDISPVDQHQPYVSLIDCQATGVLLCQKIAMTDTHRNHPVNFELAYTTFQIADNFQNVYKLVTYLILMS